MGSDVLSDTDGTVGTVTASASAWQGSTVLQFAVPNATATGARIFHTPQPAAQPGQTYTVQMRVRNVTASTSLQVKPGLGWYMTPQSTPTYSYGSTVTLTGSATAAWTLLTFTATAAAGSLGMSAAVVVAATMRRGMLDPDRRGAGRTQRDGYRLGDARHLVPDVRGLRRALALRLA